MIFIVNNRKNDKGKVFFSKIKKFLAKKKISFEVATPFEKDFKSKLKKVFSKIQFVIILGGDGTILYTFNHLVDKIKKDSIPFFTLNIGNLGYISSEDNPKRALTILKNYLVKDYLSQSCTIHTEAKSNSKEIRIEKRFFLKGLFNQNTKQKRFFALNEITLRRKGNKVADFECFINDEFLCKLRSDGILLATATGSTAYNLSANGPILNPLLPAIVFNPLCAHSLSFKPLVLSGEDKVEIKPCCDVLFSIDGREDIIISAGETIIIELSKKFLPMIKPVTDNCYNVLTKKLNWGK